MNDLIDKIDSIEIVEASELLPQDQKDTIADYEYSREKIKEIIELGGGVLEHAADIATETGEPRSIEVFSQLAKNLGDLAKSVMENNKIKSSVFKDHSDIRNPGQNGISSLTQNNNTIFVGSAAELLNMVDEEQLKVIENINESTTDKPTQ